MQFEIRPTRETPIWPISRHKSWSASHSLTLQVRCEESTSLGKKALNGTKSPLRLEWLAASKCWSDQPGTQRGDGGEPSPERIS